VGLIALPPEWRGKGRTWFVLHVGVLRLGLSAAMVTAAVIYGLDHGFSAEAYTSWRFLRALSLWIVFVGLLEGYLIGRALWRHTE
jgi:hypothetical protein